MAQQRATFLSVFPSQLLPQLLQLLSSLIFTSRKGASDMTTGTADHFPLSFPLPRKQAPQQLARGSQISRTARMVRVLAALVLVAGSVALVVFNEQFRSIEATLATLALSPFTDGHTPAMGIRYFVTIAPGSLVALRVTVECTALIFAMPFTVASALVLAFTRITWRRVCAAITLMWVIVLAVNTLRLWVIGFATHTWGMDPGYQLSHTLVGSIIGIVGFVAGVITLVTVMGVQRSGSGSPAGARKQG